MMYNRCDIGQLIFSFHFLFEAFCVHWKMYLPFISHHYELMNSVGLYKYHIVKTSCVDRKELHKDKMREYIVLTMTQWVVPYWGGQMMQLSGRKILSSGRRESFIVLCWRNTFIFIVCSTILEILFSCFLIFLFFQQASSEKAMK